MDKPIIRLKKILNTFTDKELEEIDLWIDNNAEIDIIAIDENAISLITDKSKLKINGLNW